MGTHITTLFGCWVGGGGVGGVGGSGGGGGEVDSQWAHFGKSQLSLQTFSSHSHQGESRTFITPKVTKLTPNHVHITVSVNCPRRRCFEYDFTKDQTEHTNTSGRSLNHILGAIYI